MVEDVTPPLPLGTPMLLVKPPAGLATPDVFKALDLASRSTADGRDLAARLAKAGKGSPELCVNDLEQPAFELCVGLSWFGCACVGRAEGLGSGRVAGRARITPPGHSRILAPRPYFHPINPIPSPHSMPDLAAAKARLAGEPCFDAAFMTGSGSTLVGLGSAFRPAWLAEPQYKEWFVGGARLMGRGEGGWYDAPAQSP